MYKVEWKNKHRLEGLIKGLERINNQSVSYGFFEDQGRHPEYPKYTLPEIMAMNELRPIGDPARFPVFERALELFGVAFKDENMNDLAAYLKRCASTRRPSAKNFLTSLGQNGINITRPVFGNPSLIGNSNSQFTINIKGRNTPMINTGYLADNLKIKTSL